MAELTTRNSSNEVSGIDISALQHRDGIPINWSEVSKSHDFIYVKCTESCTYSNPYFLEDIVGAHSVEMPVGYYHFADFAKSASIQARFFVNVIRLELSNKHPNKSLPLMLRLEGGGCGDSSTHELTFSASAMIDWIASFVATIGNITGQDSLIYASRNFWEIRVGNSTQFSGQPLGLAYWHNDERVWEPDITLPDGWANWVLWQYVRDRPVPGIAGNADLVRYNARQGSLSRQVRTW